MANITSNPPRSLLLFFLILISTSLLTLTTSENPPGYGKVTFVVPMKSLTFYPKDKDDDEAQAEHIESNGFFRRRRDASQSIVPLEPALKQPPKSFFGRRSHSVVNPSSTIEDRKKTKMIPARRKSKLKLQFSGIIDPTSPNPSRVRWYARPVFPSFSSLFHSSTKASSSSSSKEEEKEQTTEPNFLLRIISPNTPAITRDLLVHRKARVIASYSNTGESSDDGSGKPAISVSYNLHSKNLYDFSLFKSVRDLIFAAGGSVDGSIPSSSTSNANNGRERRIRKGVYTDGERLYCARFDYRFGKNYMDVFNMDDDQVITAFDGNGSGNGNGNGNERDAGVNVNGVKISEESRSSLIVYLNYLQKRGRKGVKKVDSIINKLRKEVPDVVREDAGGGGFGYDDDDDGGL